MLRGLADQFSAGRRDGHLRKKSPMPAEEVKGIRHASRKKKKALGPCELRALLRDAPSSPCTRHGRRRITGHHRTLRSDNASYARALDRAHNLSRLRDEIGIASDHFKGG